MTTFSQCRDSANVEPLSMQKQIITDKIPSLQQYRGRQTILRGRQITMTTTKPVPCSVRQMDHKRTSLASQLQLVMFGVQCLLLNGSTCTDAFGEGEGHTGPALQTRNFGNYTCRSPKYGPCVQLNSTSIHPLISHFLNGQKNSLKN